MDCDTTGVEPALALRQEKSLTEGGVLRLALRVLPTALEALGYDAATAAGLLAHVDATGGRRRRAGPRAGPRRGVPHRVADAARRARARRRARTSP